jgi:hypothetical protein
MTRQGTRARLGIAGFVILLFGFLGAGIAHASSSYNVYVGYADNIRANPASFPTPFDTAPGVTREGDPTTNQLDSGAVRIANTTGATETVNSVVVHVGSSQFDLWPHNVQLQSFNQLVLDQTNNSFNFDTSDTPLTCTPDGLIPTVTVTVDGVATTYNDSGQVLNTGGFDKANCSGIGANESTQWVSIGQPPCPTGAVLGLTPQTQTHTVGDQATVTANFAACGTALQGAMVNFSVDSGPNAGKTGTGVVDASGNASFSYTGNGGPGTDTVKATVVNGAGTISSNPVTVIWQAAGVTAVSGNAFGESISLHTLLGLTVSSGPTPSVTLPSSGGGPFKKSLVSLGLPGVLSAGVMDVSTRGSLGASGGSASRASTADLLLNGLLGASAVTSRCRSSMSGSTGSASAVNLSIAGQPVINGKLGPNTTIPLPLIGKVILGEKKVTNTATTSSINVNAVHVVFSGLLGTGDIIISHSHCDVTK